MKIYKFQEIILLALLAFIFFSISAINLTSPGLGDEKAFLVHHTIVLKGEGVKPCYLGIELFGRNYFAMTNAWVGPVGALLFAPSFYFFGISIYAIRLTRIFYGFITIILLYYFVKRFLTKRPQEFLLSFWQQYLIIYLCTGTGIWMMAYCPFS